MRTTMISRTLVGYNYTVKALDNECNIVERVYTLTTAFNLDNKEEYSKAIKTLRKIDETIAKITNVTAVNELYEMTERKFMELASIVAPDERRNKVTKTINSTIYTCLTIMPSGELLKTSIPYTNFDITVKEEYTKCIKGLRKIDENIAKIVDKTETENIYGLDEKTFFQFATFVPEGRKVKEVNNK